MAAEEIGLLTNSVDNPEALRQELLTIKDEIQDSLVQFSKIQKNLTSIQSSLDSGQSLTFDINLIKQDVLKLRKLITSIEETANDDRQVVSDLELDIITLETDIDATVDFINVRLDAIEATQLNHENRITALEP